MGHHDFLTPNVCEDPSWGKGVDVINIFIVFTDTWDGQQYPRNTHQVQSLRAETLSAT
jgi:hypothetical protein